jgi:hypothetical protein
LYERTKPAFAEELKRARENQKLDILSLGEGSKLEPPVYDEEVQPLERDVLCDKSVGSI